MRSFPAMIVRAFARQTLSLRYMPVIIVAVLVTLQYLQSGRLELVGTLGLILLVSGFPYAAVELVAMDRDGRLDQLRLAGWTRGRVLSLVLASSAGPWILAGAVLLPVSIFAAGANHIQIVMVAVLPVGSLALSMIAIATRATRTIDPRIATAGVFVAAMIGAGLFMSAAAATNVPLGRWLLSLSGTTVIATATVFVGLSLMAVVYTLPGLLRLLERPIEEVDRPGLGIGLTRRLRQWCPPALWRGVTLTAVPALVLSGMAVVIIGFFMFLWWVRVGDPSITMTGLTPTIVCLMMLFFGAGVISGHCREDAEVGRLHLLRLSSDRPLDLGTTIGALWLPFLLGAVTIAVVSGTMFRVPPWYLPLALLVIALLGPLAAVEGWRRYLPFGLVGPATIFVLVKSSQSSPPRSIGTFLLCLTAVGWIPWMMARETLRDPEHPLLRGPVASLAVGGLAFAIFWPPAAPIDRTAPLLQALVLSVVFVHGGAWLARPRGVAVTPGYRWFPPLAVFAVVVAVLVSRSRYTLAGAVILAVVPAAALWIGRRIHESLSDRPRWSVNARAAFVVGGVLATALMSSWTTVRLDASPDRLSAWVKQQELTLAVTMVALVALVELAFYLLLRRHERIAVVARR